MINISFLNLFRRFTSVAVVFLCATGVVLAVPSSPYAKTLRLAVPTPYTYRGHPFEIYVGGSVKSALFDGLTQISLKGELSPALALSWETVTDTEWEFRLRPDTWFHNGAPVTAEAVVAVIKGVTADESQRFWLAQRLSTLESAYAVDPHTVRITTKLPDPLLARRMSLLRVVDMKAWEELGEVAFSEDPVATGPYRVVSWGPNATQVKFEAFEKSWRPPKDVDSIDMRVVADGARRVQALLSNEIDLAVNLNADAVPVLEAANFNVLTVPNPITIIFGLRTVNAAGSPLLDKRVRQALNYAINKSQIVEYILDDKVTVASQGAIPGVIGYNPDVKSYAYDPDKARALLEEAGYGDGLHLIVAVWTGQVPGDTLIFQQAAQDLAAVGVTTEMRQMPLQEFGNRRLTGDWRDIQMATSTLNSRHLFDSFTALDSVSCKRRPSPFFCDPDLDVAIDATRYVMDPDQRNQLLQQAMAKSVETASSVFLVNYSDFVAMKSNINGYDVRSDGIMFEKLTVD